METPTRDVNFQEVSREDGGQTTNRKRREQEKATAQETSRGVRGPKVKRPILTTTIERVPDELHHVAEQAQGESPIIIMIMLQAEAIRAKNKLMCDLEVVTSATTRQFIQQQIEEQLYKIAQLQQHEETGLANLI